MPFLTIVLLAGAVFLGIMGGTILYPSIIALACFVGLLARMAQAHVYQQQLLKALSARQADAPDLRTFLAPSVSATN